MVEMCCFLIKVSKLQSQRDPEDSTALVGT